MKTKNGSRGKKSASIQSQRIMRVSYKKNQEPSPLIMKAIDQLRSFGIKIEFWPVLSNMDYSFEMPIFDFTTQTLTTRRCGETEGIKLIKRILNNDPYLLE
jgi:hypothetical protein